MDYRIFKTPGDVALHCASEIAETAAMAYKKRRRASIALSGGNSPALLFEILATEYGESRLWRSVDLFWVDERCVPPDDPESNYGNARRNLLDKIDIPLANVHRMKGEENPDEESARYSAEITRYVQVKNGYPVFDLIILGMGEDGHTASIFPGNTGLIDSERICDSASHPQTGQKRITLTGRVIKNASEILFFVTGGRKARIVSEIINKKGSWLNYPASLIVPSDGKLTWLLDRGSSGLL